MNIQNENQSGFSLVGILVGVALLGILTAGMMQVFSNMALNQNYSKFRTQVDNFGEELRTTLSDKSICTNTFSAIQMDPAVPLTFTSIKDGTGKIIYSVNSTYGDNSFILSSIDLKSQPATPWYIEDNAATGTGRMTVSVTYKAAGPVSGPKESFRTYVMQAHRDLVTNKLIDCTALAKSSGDGIWKYNGSDIYFSGGNTGIGTTTPAAPLHVMSNGKVVIESSNGPYGQLQLVNPNVGEASILFASDPSGGIGGNMTSVDPNHIWIIGLGQLGMPSNKLIFYNPHMSGVPTMTMDAPSGNVGIGTTDPKTTLDVNGSVRPGSVPAANLGSPCSPLGAQGYNATTGAPVYCNASLLWTSVGGGGFTTCTNVSNGPIKGNSLSATCPAGTTMTGGGCHIQSTTEIIYSHYPSGASTWICEFGGGPHMMTAYAICCQ